MNRIEKFLEAAREDWAAISQGKIPVAWEMEDADKEGLALVQRLRNRQHTSEDIRTAFEETAWNEVDLEEDGEEFVARMLWLIANGLSK